jgi:tetratricopeptide (TPR) repeat protein
MGLEMKGTAIAGVALAAEDDSAGDHSWGEISGRQTPHISPAEVILQCQAHLAENEEDAIEWERLAGAYADMYDWHLALNAYHTAIKLRSESNNTSGTPLNAQNFIRVGLIYETLNDFQKARDVYALCASLPGGLIASYMLKDLNERQRSGNEEDTVARDADSVAVLPDTVRDAGKEAEEEGRAEDDVEEEEADGNDSQQRRNKRRQQRRERRVQRDALGLLS